MFRLRRSAESILTLVAVRRVFQSKSFTAACRDLPTTPSGANPYDVLELTVTPSTSSDDLAKQFRSLVVKYHPDKPGGSTEKMAEVNLAYRIVKEHHESILKKMVEADNSMKAGETHRQYRSARVSRDEELGRSGGIRRNVKASQSAPGRARTHREIDAEWQKYQADTEAAVKAMCNRYELAVQQGKFFRKSASMNEVTARERWLRKAFIKGIWEEVHELRGELLRRGTRSAQQSELAESMVTFASVTQRKLNEDFQRLTQESVQNQSRMFVQRAFMMVVFLVLLVKFWKWFTSFTFGNTLTVRLKQGILSQ